MRILKRVTAFILTFIMLIQEVSYGDIYVLTDNTYNAANHLICYNGKEISYDADGNMLETPIEGELTTLQYDCRNRLTRAGTTEYKYDAENIRIETIENGKKTEYVTDITGRLSKVLVEYEYVTDTTASEGKTANAEDTQPELADTTIYVYGNGLISQENSAGYYTYHYNNIGSTTRITDEFRNNVETFTYGTYGELLNGTTEKTHYLYNGQYGVSTEDNGLYYMRQRYYNPEIKRFINQDVVTVNIDNSQSLNRYCYVQGNPVSLIDPFGLFPLSPNSLDHTIFGLLGMLPVVGIVADAIDCGLYIKEGDTANAIMSGISIAPIVGSFAVSKLATRIKKAKKTGNVVQKTTNAIEESATFLSKTSDVSKYGDEAIEIVAKGADDALEMAVDATTDIAKGTDLTTEVVRKADLENGITGKIAEAVGGKYSAFGEMSEADGIRYDGYWKYQEALARGEFKNGSIYDGWYKPNGTMNYPDNGGAIPGTEKIVTLGDGGILEVGRYGAPTSTSAYVTETGVPATKLSLPPNTDPNTYIKYRINGSISNVERAVVAPWVGDSGLGIQYKLPKPIMWYVEQGILIPG